MFCAQRYHKLLICFFLAAFVQHAHVRLTPIQCFASFSQPTCEPVVDESQFQHAFESFKNTHLRGARGGVGGDFNFVRSFRHRWGGGLFSVRLDDGLAGDGGKGEREAYHFDLIMLRFRLQMSDILEERELCSNEGVS